MLGFEKIINDSSSMAMTMPSDSEMLIAISISLGLGIVMAATTYWGFSKIYGEKTKNKHLMAAMDINFICVALTAVMILVNNNLARALAIGAALSLVRFRVKLGTKTPGSQMIFSVIAGISCGVGAYFLGALMTALYVCSLIMYVFISRKEEQKVSEVETSL